MSLETMESSVSCNLTKMFFLEKSVILSPNPSKPLCLSGIGSGDRFFILWFICHLFALSVTHFSFFSLVFVNCVACL